MKTRKLVRTAALMMGLTMLMDRESLADRAILLGWGIGLGAMTWALLRNAPAQDEPETAQQE